MPKKKRADSPNTIEASSDNSFIDECSSIPLDENEMAQESPPPFVNDLPENCDSEHSDEGTENTIDTQEYDHTVDLENWRFAMQYIIKIRILSAQQANLLLLMYMHTSNKIEHFLRVLFEYVSSDMQQNVALLFVCGVLSGGVLGKNLCAYGIAFGVSILDIHSSYLISIVATIFMFESIYMSSSFSVLGFLLAGRTIHEVFSTQKILPSNSAKMTLSVCTILSPSFQLALCVFLTLWYSCFYPIHKNVMVTRSVFK